MERIGTVFVLLLMLCNFSLLFAGDDSGLVLADFSAVQVGERQIDFSMTFSGARGGYSNLRGVLVFRHGDSVRPFGCGSRIFIRIPDYKDRRESGEMEGSVILPEIPMDRVEIFLRMVDGKRRLSNEVSQTIKWNGKFAKK